MTGRVTASRRALGAALAVAALASAHPASAGIADKLREGLFKQHRGDEVPGPPLGRYISEEGRTFTLDLTQPVPMLKFDDSPEVYALLPSPAPRGDTIYRNDLGEPVLRATRLGGVTLFTDQRPGGSAAALSGVGSPLRLAIMGPQALFERLALASARASRAARRLIPFEAEATPASSALIADSAMVTSEAVVRMTKHSGSRRMLDRILKVRLVAGREPDAEVTQGVLEVTVAPTQGLAGRPSSDRIVHVAQTFH